MAAEVLENFSELLMLGTAGLAGVLAVIVGLKRPWWAVAATLLAFPFIPFWVGQSFAGFFLNAHIALALGSIIVVLVSTGESPQLSLPDWVVVGILGLVLLAFLTGNTTLSQTYTVIVWVLFYAFARVVVSCYGVARLARWFSIACAVAAALIVVEWVTDFNFWVRFVRVNNPLFNNFSNLQSRGGVLRAEGAFGHSIPAGSSLAVAAILTLASQLRTRTRLLLVAVLAAGIVVTISRIGMVTLAVGIALSMLFGQHVDLSRRTRGLLLAGLAAGGAGVVLGLTDIFAESGSEAANSASYRLWILDLLPDVRMFGMADSFARSTSGGVSFGSYGSIDSALLLLALTQGWVVTAMAVALLAAASWRVIRLRAGPATIAVVAQIPALLTVALITQYAYVFWFSVGLAVTEVVLDRQHAAVESPAHTEPDAVRSGSPDRTRTPPPGANRRPAVDPPPNRPPRSRPHAELRQS